MNLAGRVIDELLNLLSPPTCAACDAATRLPLCEACRGSVDPAPAVRWLDGKRLVVAGNYAPPLSTAIIRFKYEGRAELSRALADLVTPPLLALDLPEDASFVPVPLHAARLATRGYNQAALLARALGKRTGRSCHPRLLARARATERQVGKARSERLTNAEDAFALRQPRVISRAILVDDVVTTGSTVRACAQALANGGIELCAVVAVAQAQP
jgi:ComF family protein